MDNALVVATPAGKLRFNKNKVENALLVVGGLEPLKLTLREVAEALQGKLSEDLTVLKNRKEYRSLAYEISKSKAPLKDICQQIEDARKAKIKEQIADKKGEIGELEAALEAVKANKKDILGFMDTLRDEMKAPAVDWEARDALRKQAHETEIAEIAVLAEIEDSQSSEIFDEAIRKCDSWVVGSHLEEFQGKAEATQERVRGVLALKRELAKNREDEAARKQEEREAEIRRKEKQKAELEAAEEKTRLKVQAEELEKQNAAMIQSNMDGLAALGEIDDNASAETIAQRIIDVSNAKIDSDHFGDRVEEARKIQAEVKAGLSKFYRNKCRLDKEAAETAERKKKLGEGLAADAALKKKEDEKADEEKRMKADRVNSRKIDKEVLKDIVGLGLGIDTAAAIKFRKFLKDSKVRHVFIKYS